MGTRRQALAHFFGSGRPSPAGRIFTIVIAGFLSAACGFLALSQVGALVYGRVALEAIDGTATSCYGEGTRAPGCIVTYTYDGDDYTISVGSSSLDVGDRVPLRFDPADPSEAYAADAETTVFAGFLVLATFGLIGVVAYQVDELRTARRAPKRGAAGGLTGPADT